MIAMVYTPSPRGSTPIFLRGTLPGTPSTPASGGSMSRSESKSNLTPNLVLDPRLVEAPKTENVRGVQGFFPPVKLRGNGSNSQNGGCQQSQSKKKQHHILSDAGDQSPRQSKSRCLPRPTLELIPESSGPMPDTPFRGQHPSLKTPPAQVSSRTTSRATQRPESLRSRFSTPERLYPNLLLAKTENKKCADLSYLPRPRKLIPKGELPWVYRFKVKKGMSELSKIMASKPPQGSLQPLAL